ncbi:unnamed protein product [Prorocentrum cordatum]|uniref:Uncharacterized protein n=1 Tax=Prorocentrum cordatum TaxID=2364126 RepID=A0ABN9S4I1_9DINO|nr:unnamed protein product [Polarella glacialis]
MGGVGGDANKGARGMAGGARAGLETRAGAAAYAGAQQWCTRRPARATADRSSSHMHARFLYVCKPRARSADNADHVTQTMEVFDRILMRREAADEENEEQTRPRSRGQRGRPGRRAPLRPRLAPRALRGCRGCAQPPRAPPPTRSRACRRAERPRGAPATASPRPGSTYGPPLSQPTRPAASGGSASARAPAASEAAPARPAGAAGPGARRRPGAARLLQRGGESTSLELDTLEAAYSSLVG